VTAVVPAGSGTVDVRVQSASVIQRCSEHQQSDFWLRHLGDFIGRSIHDDGRRRQSRPEHAGERRPRERGERVSFTPALQASAFSDPDTGDTQAASQWQVIRVSDSAVVYDSGADSTHLTSFTIPAGKNCGLDRVQVAGAFRRTTMARGARTPQLPRSLQWLRSRPPHSRSTPADRGRRVHRRRRFRRRRNLRRLEPHRHFRRHEPRPQQVYQTERFGNFTYTVPNLTPGSQYTVQLDFAELYWSAANQRLFNVPSMANPPHQIRHLRRRRCAANKAIAKSFTTTADSSGRIAITFTSLKDNAKVDGIEITPTGSPTPTPTPTHRAPDRLWRIGKRRVPRRHRFHGGASYGVTSAIDTSAVTNPAPQSVYQTERYGTFYYLIPNLTPGAAYTVKLDFAELYWSAVDQRVFNVSINNTQVLSSSTSSKPPRAKNKAIAETFTATASSAGKITILFTSVKDNAKVSGIEILPK